MPLATIRVQEPSSGRAEVHVMELINGVNYIKIGHFLTACAAKKSTPSPSLSRPALKQLLQLAQSDREREYTTYKASGLTVTGARRHYGLENMSARALGVEKCVQEVKYIRESIDGICTAQEQAAMQQLGLIPSDSESSDDDTDSDSEGHESDVSVDSVLVPHDGELVCMLRESQFNWFELVSNLVEQHGIEHETAVINELDKFFAFVMSSEESVGEKTLIEQSHLAFCYDFEVCRPEADRQAETLNGMIVTDSEHEDPDQFVELHDLSS